MVYDASADPIYMLVHLPSENDIIEKVVRSYVAKPTDDQIIDSVDVQLSEPPVEFIHRIHDEYTFEVSGQAVDALEFAMGAIKNRTVSEGIVFDFEMLEEWKKDG